MPLLTFQEFLCQFSRAGSKTSRPRGAVHDNRTNDGHTKQLSRKYHITAEPGTTKTSSPPPTISLRFLLDNFYIYMLFY